MGDEYKIDDDDVVTVTKMGHIVEIQYMQKCNRRQTVKKISKDEYVNLSTGEVCECKHGNSRKDDYKSLYKTFKNIRYLVNNNFTGGRNELFITLTYKENMTYTERLYTDFDKFIKRLRYKYRDRSTIDYISVVEPQERGAWHCHLLLRFNNLDSVYIPNDELREIWKHGFVKINRLEGVDNIGAYLTAYLTDVELDKENIQYLKSGMNVKKIKEKKYIKGGRLYLYPVGMNIYRCSRGIKKPNRIQKKYKDAKKIVQDSTPHYSKTYEIKNDDFVNIIAYEQYNMKRGKK